MQGHVGDVVPNTWCHQYERWHDLGFIFISISVRVGALAVEGKEMHLPRHQFGNLQSRMFPAYFSLVAVCAAICMSGFSILHPWKGSSSTEKTQLLSLALSLTTTLANILVFEPITIKTMRERHKVEREESIGDEVGLSKNKEAAKRNPKLANLNKKFGMVHGLSSLANLLSFGGFAVHSWYLASKLLI
ncbi:hypothetical protein GOP47_0029971 [Adiantum capillus-veneris]|nr:hypothetical protein GOP47_0029971 [Adiantum capillus-veneris]